MKSLNLRFLFLLVVITVSGDIGWARQTEELLELEIQTDKKIYTVGEPIYLTYILKNKSKTRNIVLNAQPLDAPSTTIHVKFSDGVTVHSQAGDGHWYRDEPLPILSLQPSGFYGHKVDLQEFYVDAPPMGVPHTLYSYGTYEIIGTYQNESKLNDEKAGGKAIRLWTGQVSSKPVKITIRPFTGVEIRNIERAIHSAPGAQKTAAVMLARKAKITEITEIVVTLLNADVSVETKREAARMLYEMPDEKYLQTYIKHLKSPDDNIAVYMIAALGEKLKAKAAVPALMEIANREQWPGRYHAAARALIEIGDPRAIPVIRKLAENEPDHEYLPPGALRKYFQTGLQKLEALKTQ